jgi:hypothetical protein
MELKEEIREWKKEEKGMTKQSREKEVRQGNDGAERKFISHSS